MRKRIILAGVVLVTLAACGNPYGISAEAPLGDFRTLDVLLVGKKLVKSVEYMHLRHMDHQSDTEPTSFDNEHGARNSYTDRARVGGLHVVYVFTDGDDRVAGIGGKFRTDARVFDYGVYKVTRFVADVWIHVFGRRPTFAPEHADGMIGKEMLVAKFDRGRLRGKWVKHVIGGGMRDKVLDEVLISFK